MKLKKGICPQCGNILKQDKEHKFCLVCPTQGCDYWCGWR